MSRKFNAGRQSDLLLNEKLHSLYTHLEFISYKDGNNEIISMPKQTRQTDIPKGALWLQYPNESSSHKLRVHTNPQASNVDDRWPCLFEGYYHPATLTEYPKDPVNGQIWIDENNILRVYNTTEGKWEPVATEAIVKVNYDTFNGMDFQMMDPLLPMKMGESYTGDSTYSVPYESFGKFFAASTHEDEFIYCHPGIETVPRYDQQTNETTITIPKDSDGFPAKAWVHINPWNLDRITKRLIKINKPKTYYQHVKQTVQERSSKSYVEQYSEVYKDSKIVSKNGKHYIDDIELLTEENKYGLLNYYIQKVHDINGNSHIQKILVMSEYPILIVVEDEIALRSYDLNTQIKVSVANKNKYNQTVSFKVGEQVMPIEYKDPNTYFIGVPAGKTEFYAFKSNEKFKLDENKNKIGRLLKRYSLKEGLKDDIVNDDPTILDHRNDYEIKNGGILLDDNIGEMYDYVYAITYDFKQNHTTDGNLIRLTKESLDGPDQMYVGPCTDIPVVFMDGLYLEHNGDSGIVYSYDGANIKFSGNDILDEMQILVVSFPKVNTYISGGEKLPKEYTIDESSLKEKLELCDASDSEAVQIVSNPIDDSRQISYNDLIAYDPSFKDIVDTSGNYYVKHAGKYDAVVHGDLNDSLFSGDFPNPIIFYNGLAGYTYVANEVRIDYDNKEIVIPDFGEVISDNGTSSIFAVSLGYKYDSNGELIEDYVPLHGVLDNGTITDASISADKDYLIIVDGIVMSPYNEDITIEEIEEVDADGIVTKLGKITITAATVALDSEFTLIELVSPDTDLTEEQNKNATVVVFDDMFLPYSISLTDTRRMNNTNVYNDCDSAVVMCGPGALVDRSSVLREFDPNDTFVGGQIIKHRMATVKDDEVYEWRVYNYSNDYTVLDPIEDAAIIKDCENMITYYVNKGTVLLDADGIEKNPVTVYAYTYVDSVDEKLLCGRRLIPIHPIERSGQRTVSTNRTHLYDLGVNALSVYVNGIMIPHTEEQVIDAKSDFFFVNEMSSSKFMSYTNKYKAAERGLDSFGYLDVDMLKVLQQINDNTKLEDEIVVDGDHCLVMKHINNYMNSEHQLEQALALKKYIEDDMQNNRLMYLIENVEHNEMVSCRRQWNAPRNDNGNLPNSYTANIRLTPGIINVYVNGVLLEKDDYAIYDSNKVMIGFDLVGGQEILSRDRSGLNHPYRVIANDNTFKYIECESNDEVLIEVRDDLTVKKRSYEIKDVSYESYTFDILDYEYPSSLSTTKDLIKIYINGVLYDGNYTNSNGVITLLECDLEQDPLYKYLKMYPDAKEEYEQMYGEYVKHEDIITFEWR